MSVKDLKKQLDKCDADHEQQVKDCTNKELETKEAMEKAETAHNGAVAALKKTKETRISDRLKIAKEFIDNEIKVDLKLPKYDREDVTKLMIELRQIRSKHATIEDRVEIAKRFWRLKSYFVKFPLLSRIKAALEKKKPDWKIEFRPNETNGKKHWTTDLRNWHIEKNTMEYPGLDEEWRGKFGDYQFGALYLGDTFLCGVTCEPRITNNWRGTQWSYDHTVHWFLFYHPTLLNDVTPQYWIQYSGVRPISFSNFEICARDRDDDYRDVHSVNEIRAAAMDITPEFLLGEANEPKRTTLRDLNKEEYKPGDFRNMCNILSSICETGLFDGHYKGACNRWTNDDTDGYEPDPRTRRPMDENEIADAIIQHLDAKEKAEARRKAKEEEEKRIANLPKNSEEAIGIRYPWATKVEKVLDGRDGYSYFKVHRGGKHIMLCQRDTGYVEWKRDFDKDYRQLTDSQVKYYLTGKEK